MSDDPLEWLLWVAGAALVAFIASYAVTVYHRRKPDIDAPTEVFCIPEPGADPVEAAWVSYAGRDASGTAVFLACFPISAEPDTRWEIKVGRLPAKTQLRIMFGTEQTGEL